MQLTSNRLLCAHVLTLCVSLSGVAAPTEYPASISRAPHATQANVDVLVRDAQNDFARGDYAGAIRDYEQVVALRPDSAEALSNLGVAYHFAGRLRDAVATLQKALKLNPTMAPSNLLLGIDYVKLGQAKEAIGPLEDALRKDPANRDGLFALASAYYALEEFDQAARAYHRAVTDRPTDADAWYGMGLSFEHLAERTTRRLTEIAGDSAYNQRLLGEYLIEQDAGFDAEEAFRRAIAASTEAEGEGLYAGLGYAQLRLGEIAAADEQFATERRLYPASLDGKLGAAAVAMEQKDWGKPTSLLCEAASADAGFYQTRLNFFLSLLRETTSAEALSSIGATPVPPACTAAMNHLLKEMTSPETISAAEQAFQTIPVAKPVAPGETATGIEAAQRASEAGQPTQCAKLLQTFQLTIPSGELMAAQCNTLSGRFFIGFEAARGVVKAEPHNPKALYWQAESARRLAQASFQRAVTLNPDSWLGHVLLGDVFRQRKKWDVAISHYQEAARLKPESPGPLLGLATIYWQTGRNEQGESALKKALAVDPENHLAHYMLGDIYLRERRFEDAIPHLEIHLSRAPAFLVAHGDLGKAYAALGRDKEAIAELLIALPTDRQGELHFQLHTLYKKLGQLELARQALAESEKLRNQKREYQRRRLERAVGTGESSAPTQP